jgi:hypothetical protein
MRDIFIRGNAHPFAFISLSAPLEVAMSGLHCDRVDAAVRRSQQLRPAGGVLPGVQLAASGLARCSRLALRDASRDA